MKKNYINIWIILIAIFILIWWFYYFNADKNPKDTSRNLAESQSIEEQTPREERQLPLSPQRLKQLEQIQDAHEAQIQNYNGILTNIFSLNGETLDDTSKDIIESILEENLSVEDFTQQVEQDIGISIFRSDARNLIEAYNSYKKENIVHSERLETLAVNNEEDIKNQEQELMRLTLIMAFENTSLEPDVQNRIIHALTTRLYQDNNFFESSLTEKWSILRDNLWLIVSRNSQLRGQDLQNIMEDILNTLSDVWVIKRVTSENNSAFFRHFFYNTVHAEVPEAESYESLILDSIRYISSLPESELTDMRKRILHLQIDILTDLTIQGTIEAELSYTKWEINQWEFLNIRDENFIILEEILILKSHIDNPEGIISLDEIQAFQLWNYDDDSSEIWDLSPLAYIQSQTGYVMVWNLRWSYKLWSSNMVLYNWYSLETLSDSEAIIIFADESILRLKPNTRVTLSGDPENIKTNVESWSIWSRIVRPITSWNNFTIEGNDIVLWVRGTSLYFSLEEWEVHIVDSHSEWWTVDIIWSNDTLTPGTKINISDSIEISDFSRENLLAEKSYIWDYIRDDISRLSLLLDDKARGFHNNPLTSSFGDENYLERLASEIENSLPQTQEESNHIFTTEALRNTPINNVNTENIYHKILQDRLIKLVQSSDNTVSEIQAKENAILWASFTQLDNINNKRDLERRFKLWLPEDIIKSPISDSWDIENIIDDFPVPERELQRELLEEGAKELESLLNNWDRIVKDSFELDIDLGNEILLHDWKSSNTDILDITDMQAVRILSKNESASVVLTVTLRLWNQSITRNYSFELLEEWYSPHEKLEKVAVFMQDYLSPQGENWPITFSGEHTPLIPNDFTQNDLITPIIEFDINHRLILTVRWEYKLPNYNDFEIDNNNYIHWNQNQRYTYTNIIFNLTHPDDASIQITGESRVKFANERCEGFGKLLIPATWGPESSCYSLVANADYNQDLHMRDKENIVISYNHWENEKRIQLTPWDNLWIHSDLAMVDVEQPQINDIKDQIVDIAPYDREVLDIDSEKAARWIITYQQETWVFIRRVEGSSLSYNLSNLNLWDDWAIEMSVRGEDLKKPWQHYLFSSLTDFWGNFAVYSWQQDTMSPFELRFVYSGGINPSISDTSSISDEYQKIIFTPTIHYIEWFWEVQVNSTGAVLADTIKIWANGANMLQWNGIINYLRIFKKH